MIDVVVALLPFIVGSAIVPIHTIVTILLIRSAAGPASAWAWVGGLTTVRLAQGLAFGFFFVATDAGDEPENGIIVSTVLLIAALLLYAAAGKHIFSHDDPDAPPPKWMAVLESLTPFRAYLVAGALLLVGVKFWVFTLGAIASIHEADLSQAGGIVAFLVFVALAESPQIAAVTAAAISPKRAEVVLERVSRWLTRHNGAIIIGLGLVVGTAFLIKALNGFGVL